MVRTTNAKYAKSVFYEEYNDIDVYIEDTEKGIKKIFTALLSRVLEDRYHIKEIFPLGCRNVVLRACEQDQDISERRRIYIIDSDLYLLLNENNFNLQHLFILKTYCFENILICQKAICSLINEEDSEKNASEIEVLFNFENWCSINQPLLKELFIHYALIFKHIPHIQTVHYNYNKLISDDRGNLDKAKINFRVESLRNKLVSELSEDAYLQEYNKINNIIIENNLTESLDFISGKDILLPLMKLKMKKITNFKIKNEILKLRLSHKCNVDVLKEINSLI